jgi:hypothetical protein
VIIALWLNVIVRCSSFKCKERQVPHDALHRCQTHRTSIQCEHCKSVSTKSIKHRNSFDKQLCRACVNRHRKIHHPGVPDEKLPSDIREVKKYTLERKIEQSGNTPDESDDDEHAENLRDIENTRNQNNNENDSDEEDKKHNNDSDEEDKKHNNDSEEDKNVSLIDNNGREHQRTIYGNNRHNGIDDPEDDEVKEIRDGKDAKEDRPDIKSPPPRNEQYRRIHNASSNRNEHRQREDRRNTLESQRSSSSSSRSINRLVSLD